MKVRRFVLARFELRSSVVTTIADESTVLLSIANAADILEH